MTEDAVSLEGNKISDAFAFTVATSVKGLPLGRNLSGIFPLAPDVRFSLFRNPPLVYTLNGALSQTLVSDWRQSEQDGSYTCSARSWSHR